jgi:hypothetical protein
MNILLYTNCPDRLADSLKDLSGARVFKLTPLAPGEPVRSQELAGVPDTVEFILTDESQAQDGAVGALARLYGAEVLVLSSSGSSTYDRLPDGCRGKVCSRNDVKYGIISLVNMDSYRERAARASSQDMFVPEVAKKESGGSSWLYQHSQAKAL